MSGPAELALLAGLLVDAGLKATVVLAAGWAGTRVLARSAAQRHAVWAATFSALPLLPMVAWPHAAERALDAPWIVGVWAVGVVVSFVPLVRGWLELQRVQRSVAPDPDVRGLFHSDQAYGPFTWGWLRPVIVMPREARAWSDAHRAAALAHEEAHVSRWDWAVHVAVWAISALFWFHPLVWMARRALAREAEHAADDAVLGEGICASDYAELLVRLASGRDRGVALKVGSSLIGARVRAVLAPRGRSARRWPAWLAAAMVCLSVVPSLGGVSLWKGTPESLTCSPGMPGVPPDPWAEIEEVWGPAELEVGD